MNKIIEQSLAREILRLTEDYLNEELCLFKKDNKDFSAVEKYSAIDAIKSILDTGISPTTIVEYKTKKGMRVNFLISEVLSNTSDEEIFKIFLNKLDHQNFKILGLEDVDNMYNNCLNKKYFLEKFFNIGFDFKQGSFNEVDRALNLDLDFFESCLNYKKDFNFSFKYEDNLTLDKIIMEEADYLIKNNIHSKNEIEMFINFLQKCQSVQILNNNLEKNLAVNSITQKKINIKV